VDSIIAQRARALAVLHRDVSVALTCAAAGYPDRLTSAKWLGGLDRSIHCLILDLERKDAQP
jgi:hypothetical protein